MTPRRSVPGIPRGHAERIARVIRGDVRLHSDGYRMLFLPFHPTGGKSYVYEHRIVMERKLGRFLQRGELVHHINEDKLDNRPENLEVVRGSAHQVIHRSGITDAEVAALLRAGLTQEQIVARGVSGHRVCRIRRQTRLAA